MARQQRFRQQGNRPNADHADTQPGRPAAAPEQAAPTKYAAVESTGGVPSAMRGNALFAVDKGQSRLCAGRCAARGGALHPVRQADLHRRLPGAHRHPALHPPPDGARPARGAGGDPRIRSLPSICGRVCPQEEPVRGAVRADQGAHGAGGHRPARALRRRSRHAAALARGRAGLGRAGPRVAIVGSGLAGWRRPPISPPPTTTSRCSRRCTWWAACCATAFPRSGCRATSSSASCSSCAMPASVPDQQGHRQDLRHPAADGAHGLRRGYSSPPAPARRCSSACRADRRGRCSRPAGSSRVVNLMGGDLPLPRHAGGHRPSA